MSGRTAWSSNVAVYDSPPTKSIVLAARGIVALDAVMRATILAGLCATLAIIWPGEGLVILAFIPIMGYAVWNLVLLAAEVRLLWRPCASVRSTRIAL